MKRIVPIFLMLLTLCILCVSVFATIGASTDKSTGAVVIVAITTIPFAIGGLVGSVTVGALTFLLRKDIVCKIAALINLVSLILSATSLIIWTQG